MGCEPCKKTSIGGQALIEGIMMRGPHKTVMACRMKDGTVSVEPIELNSVTNKYKFLGLPIIRGAVNLVESMVVGYKTMMASAEKTGMFDELDEEKKVDVELETEVEENTEVAAEAEAEQAIEDAVDEPEAEENPEAEEAEAEPEVEAEIEAETKPEPEPESEPEAESEKPKKKSETLLTAAVSVVASVLGVLLAVLLFFYLPSKLFDLINSLSGGAISAFKAPFEGIFKIIIFLVYMFAVSYMQDIKRVFMYHGAEHKTIFCYEKGLELTVENVREQRRFHPRCGTSFLILMLIVSIVFYQLLLFIPAVRELANITWLWACIKLLLLPVICGIGYELIKFCGRHDNWLTRIISAPGLWVQRISTKEPDDGMIEVAIAALSAVIPENEEDDRW